jgi:predicted Zn finger-like uncharacterized protein
MIEIQCTSCQTRYRIDERILPDETPTFKCSRCGHVFSAEPRARQSRGRADDGGGPAEAGTDTKPATKKPAPDRVMVGSDTAGAASKAAAEPPQDDSNIGGHGAPADEPSPGAQAQSTATPPPAPSAAPVGGADEATAAKPASRPAASELSFREHQQRERSDKESERAADPGDNLSFDFSDEAHETFSGLEPPKADSADKWEVGEPPPPPPPAARKSRRIRTVDIDETPDESRRSDRIEHEEAGAAAQRLEMELRNRSSTLHSAGFFIGVFALLIFGFGLASLVICGAPIASAQLLGALPVVGPSLQPPVSPAQRVALTQVQAHYASIKDNETALIISGTAENVSMETLGAVQIGAALIGPQQQVLRAEAVYCGNNLSSTMVGEMTPRELEFFEKLNGPANFTLAPQARASFVIVFVAPPTGASRFQLRVAKAEPISTPPPASTGR